MIITDHAGQPKKLRAMLLIPGLLVLLVSGFTQVPAAQQAFEVASVRRNVSDSRPWLAPPVAGRFTATNIPLKQLIGLAWPLKLSGGPGWVVTDGYDVSAIMPTGNQSVEALQWMMQGLLRDRFGLKVHTETREAQVYVLLPAKTGLKLPEANPEPCLYGWNAPDADPQAGCGSMNVTPESITNQKIAMQWFVRVLGGILGRPVLNKTGFTGTFNAHLEFAPVALDADSTKPSISDALGKQLGLRLVSEKGTEEILVIDHVERPSEN